MPGDAFLRLDVDQQQRRRAYRALARAERELIGTSTATE